MTMERSKYMNSMIPAIQPFYQPIFLPEANPPMHCRRCGSIKFKKHGKYSRKVHCGNELEVINPTYIQRYYCFVCKHTFSVLPDWLPPKRWYVWAAQENAL